MNKIILIISILFLTTSIKGQVLLVDSITNEPIVGATIYSNDGLSLDVSDINGIIDISKYNTDRILIQHVSYESKEISTKMLSKSKTIIVSPRNIQLESILVQDPNKYDYVVLKGYFRTYFIFNNKPNYFYDGIIEYYIPIKNQRKVYHKLLEYRYFQNNESVNDYVHIFGISLSFPPKIFPLESKSSINQIPKGVNHIDKGDKIFFMKDGLNMGFIQKTKSGNIQFYFDKVPPQKKISRTLFKIKGELYRGLTIENYSETDIKNPSLKNLINGTRLAIGAVQIKKEHGFIPMETFEEFYVIERSYLQKADVDKLKKSFTKSIYLDTKSNYSREFWKDLKDYNISPLSNNILKQLNTVLEEK
ncbi:peptidase associated/transthyretin-like domain-containing protein [Sphingobacterium lactis]|uniref:CarboxypepD_reg-like domain-containing protein n=1 Tax=Sphingobacterium lactis TaxID=797291 RepID=A0A1H5VT30_9SPHI|nr:hypothetical protein [Sphingobacterium lactis]SEF90475.1 hypothetical protein SAMN05421877_103227 [Sphingobacterium lactis]